MNVTKISNLNFTKLPKKNSNIKKQKIKILTPSKETDSEKILVIMTNSPAVLYVQGLLKNDNEICQQFESIDKE